VRATPARRDLPLGILVLAILYTGVAKLGLSLDAVSGFATLVWPSTGLALAALLLFGSALWPGVLLGAWAVNVWAGAPVVVALGLAIGNTLEALLGAYVMRRLARFERTFDSLRHVLGLILGAAGASTLVSATIGVTTLCLGGIVRSAPQAVETWRAWWVGDILGDLVVAPLLLTWIGTPRVPRPTPARVAEAVALAASLAAASYATFLRQWMPVYPFGWPYVLFPLFVWAGLRFELRGASLATALVSALAIWGTAQGFGAFAGTSLAASLLALQTFMGCAAITPLVVAGATMDRARAMRAQETFVATVSHDLKNPLNALLWSGEALLRRPTEEGVKKHHQILRRSADRMMRLITDVLDASSIERGLLPLEPRPESTEALVTEALDLVRPLAVAKKLTLDARRIEALEVQCDRGRVLQVLSNVIGNAIKFSPEQATIAVAVESHQDGARFSIRDAGPGIRSEDLPHVFDRYWHAKASSGGGSGLGLFIAKGVVEAHGGRIWIETVFGKGTTVHFTLPVNEPAPRTRNDRPLRHNVGR
jgi:signal transduction histidine kinase